MFEKHLMEYYKFTTKEDYRDNVKVFYHKECTPSLYMFGEISWAILPERLRPSTVMAVKKAEKTDTTLVSFLGNESYSFIENTEVCRKLTLEDKEIFNQLLGSLTEAEKSAGAVSLDDPVAYGLIKEGKIVAAASLWHFGVTLSDIGVLTHSDYRNCGYAESVCKFLIANEDRNYIWRSADNPASRKLSEKLGFTETGFIHSLVL